MYLWGGGLGVPPEKSTPQKLKPCFDLQMQHISFTQTINLSKLDASGFLVKWVGPARPDLAPPPPDPGSTPDPGVRRRKTSPCQRDQGMFCLPIEKDFGKTTEADPENPEPPSPEKNSGSTSAKFCTRITGRGPLRPLDRLMGFLFSDRGLGVRGWCWKTRESIPHIGVIPSTPTLAGGPWGKLNCVTTKIYSHTGALM